MWVASQSAGLGRHLQHEELYAGAPYLRAYDSEHIVFATREDPPLSPEPQPVYLLSLETGQKTKLGETVRGWLEDIGHEEAAAA